MSLFLAYFEEKNEKSTNYQGFKDVGKFQIPQEINAGKIDVLHNDMVYSASLISDHSRQSINYVLNNKDIQSRRKIIEFIKNRQSNECIKSIIIGFIEGANEMTIKSLKKAEIRNLENLFQANNFQHGCGFIIHS